MVWAYKIKVANLDIIPPDTALREDIPHHFVRAVRVASGPFRLVQVKFDVYFDVCAKERVDRLWLRYADAAVLQSREFRLRPQDRESLRAHLFQDGAFELRLKSFDGRFDRQTQSAPMRNDVVVIRF
jgi:hypothetical protein